MDYYKKYKEPGAEKAPVSLEKVRKILSGAYKDIDMALEFLHEHGEINTMFSVLYCE